MRCAEKVRFETKAKARLAAGRYHQYGNARGRPYRCPECGCWHLTSAGAELRSLLRAKRRLAP